MKSLLHPLALLTLLVTALPLAAAPEKKKAAKPGKSVTVKDLAIRELKKCDGNGDGRINPGEMMAVRNAWKAKPDGYLYLFDDNDNRYLDDTELAKIDFAKSIPPKPGVKKLVPKQVPKKTK